MIPSNGRPRRALTLVAATLCAGLLAGCGGSSGGAKAKDEATASSTAVPAVSVPLDQPQKPACGFITAGEVEAAIGAKVNPAKPETREGRSLCSFTVAGKAEESVVLISTTSSGVPAYFASAFDKANAPQTVTAGDQAFVSGPGGLVRKGNTMVAILVVLRQPASQLQAAAAKITQAVGTHI